MLFTHMVEPNHARLSDVLKAASDPTRRSILTLLAQEGPTRVTDLADHYDMSLNSVSKHIKVLEKAELVTRRTIGRVHLIEANLEPVNEIDNWFNQLRSIWELRLEALDNLISKKPDMTDLTLNVSRTINASAKRLFDAWLDPDMLARFMTPGPGMTVPTASSDATVGGRFDIVMKAGDQEIPHHGIYKKIDPYSQLVFTWQSPMSVDDSTVTVDFAEIDGGTRVDLTHVKFTDEESRDNHAGGWAGILGALDSAAT